MLPKYRQLKYQLVQILNRDRFKPHDRLPSERELARELGANEVTLAKALQELVQEGVVYRRSRSGTFMAPVTRRGQVLLVTIQNADPSFPAFLKGVMAGINAAGADFYPIHLLTEDFLRALPDLDLIFRDIAFVVFYRDGDMARASLEHLEKKSIPWCFYGSDAFLFDGFPERALLYSEKDIADLAIDRLFTRHAGPYGVIQAHRVKVTGSRRERFLERLSLHGQEHDPGLDLTVTGQWTLLGEERTALYEWVKRVVSRGAGVFSTQDHLSMRILQAVQQFGYSVPRDFPIVSVDNLPFAELASPALTTVDIPVMADGQKLMTEMVAQFRGPHPFHLWSEVKLVVRQSG